jgi:hypothetical protein
VEQLEDRSVPSTLAAEIPGSGVWRWMDSTGWKQLTPTDVSLVACDSRGDVVANASQVAIDANGDVAALIHNFGVWRFEDSTGWQMLNQDDAGIWLYTNGTLWQRLSPASPSQMAFA